MLFADLSKYFDRLEKTTSRIEMTKILAELFKKASVSDIGQICYLLQGRVAPLYEPLEFGLADKLVIKAIARTFSQKEETVNKEFKKIGDLGNTAEFFKKKFPHHGGLFEKKEQSVKDVFNRLYKLAQLSGGGSQEQKLIILSELISDLDSLSARFVTRIVLAKLRLGFSDMTILDALSWMKKQDKSLRTVIESAYHVRPDLSAIASIFKEKGEAGVKHIIPQVGTPILMARAERMSNATEILDQIGKCGIENKYDGFRIQVHKNKNKVRLFSRNLENVSTMYPDICAAVTKYLKKDQVILEGEAIAYNPKTQKFLPFQETVQRKRKYDIAQKAIDIPLRLIVFELLLVNDQSLINEPFAKRRKHLEKILSTDQRLPIILSHLTIVNSEKQIDDLFLQATNNGYEGIMAKKLTGVYQAGARGSNWIKYKKSYNTKISDTIDTIVMGFDRGQGKRNKFGIGDFLIGIMDEKTNQYVTVAKIGTGLSDEEWVTLKVKSQKLKVKSKPKNYDVDKAMECDIWVEPKVVVEIRADEITRSPVHTAGRVMGKTKTGGGEEVKEPGYALRFPRLERFRPDKRASEVTTLQEVIKLFKLQSA